tara:strand:+ start:850 stop:1029 length:180 start_codon:yes stop_codon:yes gene_type:complete
MGKKCCDINGGCKPKIIKTPRNKFERYIDRYNHSLELIRTILAFATVTLQIIILYRLWN